jgi:hypothetical protein
VTVLSARDKGAHAELLFCAEAGARGYTIFTPLVGSPRADVCLKMGQGPYIGIQVKRACLSTQADGFYKVSTSSRNKKYSTGDFDVLAAYLPDLHEFVFYTRMNWLKSPTTARSATPPSATATPVTGNCLTPSQNLHPPINN